MRTLSATPFFFKFCLSVACNFKKRLYFPRRDAIREVQVRLGSTRSLPTLAAPRSLLHTCLMENLWTLRCRDWLFFSLFRIDDTSNEILLFLHSRRRCVKSISEFHCVVAWHCWSRQRPSDAQMSVGVTFGAWRLWHDFGRFAAWSNRIGFVMVSGPLCLRTHVLLYRGAHAYGMRRGCPDVPSLACWRFGPVIALPPCSLRCGLCKPGCYWCLACLPVYLLACLRAVGLVACSPILTLCLFVRVCAYVFV